MKKSGPFRRWVLPWAILMWLTMVVYIPLFYEARDAADWGYLLSPVFFVGTRSSR